MYNWNTDTKHLKKHPEAYKLWKLEQLINYGLAGAKLGATELKRYWPKLRLKPHYKKFLELLLWPKPS